MKGKYKYKEYSGLLDFNSNKLEKLIISMDKGNIDDNDDQIFLPQNIKEMLDYEYIFHTHPPTPSIGKRIKNDNVLYEFPSIQDIIHFIEHSNYGVTQRIYCNGTRRNVYK